MNITASLVTLRAALAWLLILLLGGEFIQLSSAVGSNVTVPSDFTTRSEEMRDYLCNGCSDDTTRPNQLYVGFTCCQWMCQSSWGTKNSAEQTVCQKNSDSSTLCDDDQSMYCEYGDEAQMCKYDDSDDWCMYFLTYRSGSIYKYMYCVCGSDQNRHAVVGMSCSEEELESTTIRMKTEIPSTRQPLATVNGASTSTDEPLATVNVTAIVLGTVLAALLIGVTLGLLCLFRTNRLKCGAGTGVSTADASIEMAQNDNECAQGQRSVVFTNAYEDASIRDGTTDNAYKSLHLSHEQSHYYSRIPEGGGNTDARTAQEEVTPSAPPMEGHRLDTEAQEGHEYFVLEREQSTRSKADNSNHEYFVLEKDELSGEGKVWRQEEGAEDTDTPEKEVDSTVVLKPAATIEGYDHIKRKPQDNTTDNTYSHLNPNPKKEYDHLSRPVKNMSD